MSDRIVSVDDRELEVTNALEMLRRAFVESDYYPGEFGIDTWNELVVVAVRYATANIEDLIRFLDEGSG